MSSHSQATLARSLLGSITEICIVTPNLHETAMGLTRLGIGPFQVFDFTEDTVSNRQFRGKAGDFELKVAFAKQGELVFELMQPVRGESLMSEFLSSNGGAQGVQHVAFGMNDIPMNKRQDAMKERGFPLVMEGRWKGAAGICHFCFFDTLADTGTIFETISFSEDWEDPLCEWIPSAPGTESQDTLKA